MSWDYSRLSEIKQLTEDMHDLIQHIVKGLCKIKA
jgi:hypothetical protein